MFRAVVTAAVAVVGMVRLNNHRCSVAGLSVPMMLSIESDEGSDTDFDTRTGKSSPTSTFLPSTQAYSKRWVRTKELAATGSTFPPLSPSSPAKASTAGQTGERKVQWDVGLAGYKHPGNEVTPEQVRAAASLLQSATRIAAMVREPLIRQACERVGVVPEDLIPKSKAAFALVEGKAIAAGQEHAEEQWESYQRRMARKLAIVVAERDRYLEEEAVRKEKDEQYTKQLLKRFQEEMDAEAAKVEREEKAILKLAQVRVWPCSGLRTTRLRCPIVCVCVSRGRR